MALNSAQKAKIKMRRADVARLRLRGLSQRQILDALKSKYEKLDIPISLGTVNGDLKALERRWEKQADEDIKKGKAITLAEIREARAAMWATKNWRMVAEFLRQERQLMGYDSPTKTDLTSGGEKVEPITVIEIVPPEAK